MQRMPEGLQPCRQLSLLRPDMLPAASNRTPAAARRCRPARAARWGHFITNWFKCGQGGRTALHLRAVWASLSKSCADFECCWNRFKRPRNCGKGKPVQAITQIWVFSATYLFSGVHSAGNSERGGCLAAFLILDTGVLHALNGAGNEAPWQAPGWRSFEARPNPTHCSTHAMYRSLFGTFCACASLLP